MRRVRRPERHSQLLIRLTDKDEGVFETYKDALVFAAALGAARGRSEDFEKLAEPIDYQIFARWGDQEALFDALALFDSGAVGILSGESAEERLGIFERYANGGLEIIAEATQRADQPTQVVVQRIIAEDIGSKSRTEDDEYTKLMEEIGAGNIAVEGGSGPTRGAGDD